jgi:DNA-binding IclR family transcriptional regulator
MLPLGKTQTYKTGSVKSVSKALEVLSCFSVDRPEWGVTEVAEHLGLFKSAAHRFLRTLEGAGYLESTPEHRYTLGLKVLELGHAFRHQNRLIGAAEPPLRWLAESTGLTTHLVQLSGRDVVELLRARGIGKDEPHRIPVFRRRAHATASGKVLLSCDEGRLEEYLGSRRMLARCSPHTITDPQALRQSLKRAAECGYALDQQESRPGQFCLAIPIHDRDGCPVTAISISSTLQDCCHQLPLLWSVGEAIEKALL